MPGMQRDYVLALCCEQHDLDYADPKVGRLGADNKLFKFVNQHSNILMASVVWVGVGCLGWLFKHYVPEVQ